ncbi:anaerobic ribonucleoside-triphosphate reductase activating protein, partial [candidate division WOR-3 bacterium]|nr:anaerobic ribonucleoside-triphosphate reductase activating protein [candidate division WOR-3 bacterium]
YIAMDIKTSLNKYYIAAGINIKTDMIKESIELIIRSDIDSEFRTTCVPDIVDSSDIREIGSYIVGAKKFALQQFRKEKTLNEEFSNKHPYKPEEIVKFKDILKQFIDNIVIRGL